ncbi:hypothetical protein TNCV_4091191 [Trichonephila clavipes]|nr:hypothetical protein TNCV_4091191 [Trichonephila clavipes]
MASHYMPVTKVDVLLHCVETAKASVPVHAIQSLFYSLPSCIRAVTTAWVGCSGFHVSSKYEVGIIHCLLSDSTRKKAIYNSPICDVPDFASDIISVNCSMVRECDSNNETPSFKLITALGMVSGLECYP